MKITWPSSQRIHRTIDGKNTICGHDITKYIPKKKKKRHCRTCFNTKESFKEKWGHDLIG